MATLAMIASMAYRLDHALRQFGEDDGPSIFGRKMIGKHTGLQLVEVLKNHSHTNAF
jgi:hypothetical protein